MTNQEIRQMIPTISDRPQVYYDLVRRLIAEGFSINHTLAEWSNGEVTGRICCTPNRAWLRHRQTEKQPEVVTSHVITA